MNRKIRFFLFAMLMMQRASAQSSFASELDQYRKQRLEEKLFVHTDKEVYLSGEICWFKLYMLDAATHHPLDLSKVAYLEWLDKDNKPVLQAKAGMSGGHGDGSVYLPMTLRTGSYKLRAYTSWMKNLGADWFFEKTITVINTRRSAERRDSVVVDSAGVDKRRGAGGGTIVAFFPEGGNFVENLPARVAFRVTDGYGRGISCTGVVLEDEQDTVARAEPWRFGIGSFTLTPKTGHHYRAIFRLADGEAVNSLLPAAEKQGTVMSVRREGANGLRVDVRSTTDGAALYLIAQTRQSVRQVQTAVLQGGAASFLVDRDSLGEGISHLTLFNTARQPLAERLVFRQPASRLNIALHTDKNSYGTREKVGLELSTNEAGHGAMAADCSVSVFLEDSLQGVTMGHILPWLWLVSDLKGAIEGPGYYFEHPEDEQAMDNLMMTHGWRRFRWEEVLRHDPPAFRFPPEYNGSIVTGKVTDIHTGAAASNVLVYLSVPGTRTQFSVARSDEQGAVRFEMHDLYGSQELIAQTLPADSQYKVDISNPFSDEYTHHPFAPYSPSEQLAATLTDRSVAEQALNRYGGVRLKQLRVPMTDTGAFYDRADFSYTLDDFVRFTTMEEVLREYVTLLFVQKREGHFHLPLFNLAVRGEVFEADPLVLLDGVPVFDLDKLLALDPLKIRKLETVQHRYFLGATHFDGILNWISYKGDLAGYILDPRAVVVDYPGLELQREFYSPSYPAPQDDQQHLPDFRNVLFWSPQAATDSAGKKTVDFYSSDLPGRYIIVTEGITPDGRAGTGIARFEVK